MPVPPALPENYLSSANLVIDGYPDSGKPVVGGDNIIGNPVENLNTNTISSYFTILGSKYTPYKGETPPTSIFSTKDSLLHYDRKEQTEGYSTLGALMKNYPNFFQEWMNYNPATPLNLNYLPAASQLELNDPIGVDPNNKSKYNSVTGNRYQDTKPK
jgi:hypothetical protein